MSFVENIFKHAQKKQKLEKLATECKWDLRITTVGKSSIEKFYIHIDETHLISIVFHQAVYCRCGGKCDKPCKCDSICKSHENCECYEIQLILDKQLFYCKELGYESVCVFTSIKDLKIEIERLHKEFI